MLTGKTIVVGITGSIAVYKACEVVSSLKKLNAEVKVVMTKSATEFVAPLTFETLSKNRVVCDMFDRNFEYEVGHISLAKQADLFLVAPISANFIAKMANGIADDMLSSTILATKAPIMIAPAMNTNMFENPVTQENLSKLKKLNVTVIEPESGLLACGDVGKGRFPEPKVVVDKVKDFFSKKQDFKDRKVLITAGSTIEPIDRVRYITNHSSGKMGIALCKTAIDRGAEVTLIAGKLSVSTPQNIKIISVNTTEEMLKATLEESLKNDIIIKAAAPSDYRVNNYSDQKIKSEKLSLELVKNSDIAKEVGKIKGDRKLVVFSAETNDLIDNATKKLFNKNADLVVANDVTQEGAGFGVDTNIVTLIDRDGEKDELPIMSKVEVAEAILDKILKL